MAGESNRPLRPLAEAAWTSDCRTRWCGPPAAAARLHAAGAGVQSHAADLRDAAAREAMAAAFEAALGPIDGLVTRAGLANTDGRQGVRINAVNPGLVATSRLHEGLAAQARASGDPVKRALACQRKALPLGRICEADEVARVVLAVDGGLTRMVV